VLQLLTFEIAQDDLPTPRCSCISEEMARGLAGGFESVHLAPDFPERDSKNGSTLADLRSRLSKAGAMRAQNMAFKAVVIPRQAQTPPA